MLFFEMLAMLVAVYGWNFRILQTKMLVKRALSEESSYEISSKLLRNSEGALLILARLYFFQFLHNTYFFSAMCLLQLPCTNTQSQWYQRLNMWYQQSTGVQTHWHRESATKGTEGYQHIESVVPKTDHVVPD